MTKEDAEEKKRPEECIAKLNDIVAHSYENYRRVAEERNQLLDEVKKLKSIIDLME